MIDCNWRERETYHKERKILQSVHFADDANKERHTHTIKKEKSYLED